MLSNESLTNLLDNLYTNQEGNDASDKPSPPHNHDRPTM